LDWESVAAGLLHDTVEDTNVVTFERIEEEFGATVRRIVEGETKVLIYLWMLTLETCSSVSCGQTPDYIG
jgi:(p)ppGpp synthase/HD superfamily hydrolase